MPTQDGTVRQLTKIHTFPPVGHVLNQMRANTYPVWSPDGTWIAFISSDFTANMDIYVISPDGADLRRVARDVGTPAPLQLRWSSFQERHYEPTMLLGMIAILILAFALSKLHQNT